MNVKIEESWKLRLAEEFEKDYFKELLIKVDEEYANYTVYPARGKIFSALTNCDLKDVNVVKAMDSDIESAYSLIIPAALKKDGDFTATSSVVTEEQFDILLDSVSTNEDIMSINEVIMSSYEEMVLSE